MKARLELLSPGECDQLHERTLNILSKTGMRVDTRRGRQILGEAGASVNEASHIVRLPHSLVEEALRRTPKEFTLGGRRPAWDLPMNQGYCTLSADGGAVMVLDSRTGERRRGNREDWLASTRIMDSLEEIGVYWWMVEGGRASESMGDFVAYWRRVFENYSKHIQDSCKNPQETRWLLEILSAVFGSQDAIRRTHPISLLICPLSPLVIEESYTDAYLETVGWDIPVAIMPMPLMGMTSPASLISTLLLGNCEVLGMLTLIQAAAPGTPVIYAPALAAIEPRTGRYSSGAVEHSLLGAAVTRLARYYHLPAEACTGGTDHHIPGIQAGFERAVNWTLPSLAWPDILVGPGLLSGSTVLSLEQMLIDVEVFRRCKRLVRGIESSQDEWLEEVIARVGPGGSFLTQRSTRSAVHGGEWYISQLGVHATFEAWEAMGRPDILDEIREKIDQLLATHRPLPLDEGAAAELAKIEQHARRMEKQEL